MENPDPDTRVPSTRVHDGSRARGRGRPASDAAHIVPEERMLDLAFATFAALGFEGTTVRDLAKQLGVSHNLLNVRFGSKADLWRRAVDSRVARFGGPVFSALDQHELDAVARLRLLVHRFCAWSARNPDFVRISSVEGCRDTWRLRYLVDLYIRPFKERLDALLGELRTHRSGPLISSSAFMAVLVQGVGFYFASRPMLDALGAGDEVEPARLARRVDEFSAFLMAGLLGNDIAMQDRLDPVRHAVTA